jgi:hypothetical protein
MKNHERRRHADDLFPQCRLPLQLRSALLRSFYRMTIGFVTNDKHLWFEVVMTREAHRFTMPSFDANFGPFERGGGSSGQAYVGLSEDVHLKIREELRRSLNDTGGPVHVDVEFRFASGRR